MLAPLLLALLWGGSLQDTRAQLQATVQEGLCVLVPCSFSYPPRGSRPPSDPLYLYWFREGDSVYYDDLVATNNPRRDVKTRAKGRFLVLGDVRSRDCSLSIRDAKREDTGTYFFQVESGDRVKYSYESSKLNLLVTGTAGARERTLRCGVPALEQGRDAGTCPAPGLGAGVVKSCRTRGRLRAEALVPGRSRCGAWPLPVPPALTERPHIHGPEPLQSGRPTELSCGLPGSCEGGRPLSFSWSGAALHALDPDSLHSSAVTLTPRPQDHGTNLTCQVKLQGTRVTTERTVQLNVSYAPRNLTVGIFRNCTAPQDTAAAPPGPGVRIWRLCSSWPPAEGGRFPWPAGWSLLRTAHLSCPPPPLSGRTPAHPSRPAQPLPSGGLT
ncbi:sialic acid-binding Ig-like lectin 14 isoform X3 [Microcebus murinus]|uniref:sialic acid-binding Ig-like lectin 14 isoform X3 n=1 Tax=Microcebus murinus TaxID=30608 RepID=UPI003F6B1282